VAHSTLLGNLGADSDVTPPDINNRPSSVLNRANGRATTAWLLWSEIANTVGKQGGKSRFFEPFDRLSS
jgi:hypothetical protein